MFSPLLFELPFALFFAIATVCLAISALFRLVRHDAELSIESDWGGLGGGLGGWRISTPLASLVGMLLFAAIAVSLFTGAVQSNSAQPMASEASLVDQLSDLNAEMNGLIEKIKEEKSEQSKALMAELTNAKVAINEISTQVDILSTKIDNATKLLSGAPATPTSSTSEGNVKPKPAADNSN